MKPMRSAIAIRKEHKAVRSKMDELMRDGDAAGTKARCRKTKSFTSAFTALSKPWNGYTRL
jgi:hypothetical protein